METPEASSQDPIDDAMKECATEILKAVYGRGEEWDTAAMIDRTEKAWTEAMRASPPPELATALAGHSLDDLSLEDKLQLLDPGSKYSFGKFAHGVRFVVAVGQKVV